MKRVQFVLPDTGGGSEIEALFLIFPHLKMICGERRIGALCFYPPSELLTFSYLQFLMGSSCAGRVYLVKNGTITAERSWEEIREHRGALGFADTFFNSPQTELSGDEDSCILVHEHHLEHGAKDNWISVDVFMCPPGIVFRDFPDVRGWIAESLVRGKLREGGFIK